MVRLVDVPLDNGDPNRAIATFNEIEAAPRNDPAPQPPTNKQPTTDARFAGKTTEELVEMYRNLESHSGRLASQLGESRNQLNALILGKRENDLRQNSEPTSAKLEPAALLSNPTEALDRYLQSRQDPMVRTLQQRLDELEGKLQAVNFSSRHSDAEQVTADPAFAAWVRQTPLRSQLAARAAQNDMQAADLLLTEWNLSNKAKENPVVTAQDRAQELARKLQLESGNAGDEGGAGRKTGKVFKRADLIAMRMTRPDDYEAPAFQREIVKAYQEGRVVD